MLLSLSLIILCGLALASIAQKLKLPPLLGTIITGIVIGPYALDLINEDILAISADIRELALVILMLRAGLVLDLKELKAIGRPAALMCCVPALFEIATVTVFGPLLFDISYIDAAIMGAMLGAVSPAIVVPRMIKLIKSGHGTDKNIPTLLVLGSSADDLLVIVLFVAFMDSARSSGAGFDFVSILLIPVAIITGLLLGVLVGFALVKFFKAFAVDVTIRAVLILGLAVGFVALEHLIDGKFPFTGLMGVISFGCVLLKYQPDIASTLSTSFEKIWVFAEIFLFVLVGAAVDLTNLSADTVLLGILLIFVGLVFRLSSVWLCLIKTPLNNKEKLFCAISYIPKAAVQAALLGLPLAEGMASGMIILIVGVIAILLTAPLGALGMDLTYKKLLKHNPPQDTMASDTL